MLLQVASWDGNSIILIGMKLCKRRVIYGSNARSAGEPGEGFGMGGNA